MSVTTQHSGDRRRQQPGKEADLARERSEPRESAPRRAVSRPISVSFERRASDGSESCSPGAPVGHPDRGGK